MLLGEISHCGALQIVELNNNQNFDEYAKLLDEKLLTFAAETLGQNWNLVHDGASIHPSKDTKQWIAPKTVNVLQWPTHSMNLICIENVLGTMFEDVNQLFKQSETLKELVAKIE